MTSVWVCREPEIIALKEVICLLHLIEFYVPMEVVEALPIALYVLFYTKLNLK